MCDCVSVHTPEPASGFAAVKVSLYILCVFVCMSVCVYVCVCLCSFRDLELPASAPEPSQMRRAARSNLEDAAQRAKDAGNDSASTAPRSTEASLSEDVFTESEISPVRDDPDPSSDELRRLRASGASSESVQTINQADPPSSTTTPAPDALSPSHTPRQALGSDEASRREGSTTDCLAQQGEPSVGRGEQTTSTGAGEGEAKSHITPESQASDRIEAKKQNQSGVQTQNQKGTRTRSEEHTSELQSR